MDMTVKQIAEELGVTKQAVRQRIKRNPELRSAFEQHSRTENGTVYIDEQGVEIIRAAYSKDMTGNKGGNVTENNGNKRDNVAENSGNAELIAVLQKTVDMLTEQVTQKDKQINELSEMLKATQTQNTALTDALTAAQALHAGTIQTALTEHSDSSEAVIDEEPQRRGLFARIFGRK